MTERHMYGAAQRPLVVLCFLLPLPFSVGFPLCGCAGVGVQGMRSQLEKAFGAPQMPTHEEVTTAVKEIVVADIQQQQQHLEKSSAGAKAAKAAAAEAAARGGRVSLARRGGRAALAATAASLSQLD